MKTIINYLTVFILVLGSINAQEKVDLFGISFIRNPKVELKSPVQSELGNQDLSVTEMDAFIRYPIQLNNEKTVLINTLKWHFVKPSLDDLPADRSFDANLHSIQYDFTIRHELSNDWLVLASLRPTLSSNFKEGVSGDDFFFQGMAGFKYRASEFTNYGAGVSYTNGFGEPKTVPVLLFDYNTEHLEAEIKAPISASFKFQPKNISYGLEAKLEGGQYHLASNGDSGPVVANNETVKFSRYNIGPTIGWHVDEKSRFEVSAGISLKRTLKVIDNLGVETDYDLENGLFIKTAFIFGK